MKRAPFSGAARAMTLIELLCVIAIIAVLAALLLPALNQTRARALRLQCNQQLHEIGVGFICFANDHNGKFPMAVPRAAGGSSEFAFGAQQLQGDFYFSFRHFQVLSNELVAPRLVACPADTRLPARSFAALNNSNLSYFVGLNAEFSRPTSILAGDRNLTNDYVAPGTMAQLGPNYSLRWTRDLHQFKGNLLFSDGHTEETTSAGLVAVTTQSPVVANLVFPSVRSPGLTSSPDAGVSSVPPGSLNAFSPCTLPTVVTGAQRNGLSGTGQIVYVARRTTSTALPASWASSDSERTPSPPKTTKPATNTVATTNVPSRAELKQGQGETNSVAASPAPTAVASNPGQTGWWWRGVLLLLVVAAVVIAWKLAEARRTRASKQAERLSA
jgi:prepilin-type N-terminal cleavage/methylation domain-containing protein/prepilin-type processing-associated H-X9-DG protein